MAAAYIGIGSNVNRDENIRAGLKAIRPLGTSMQVSSIYESKAYGFDSDNFYNLTVRLETSLDAETLNGKLRQIEQQYGRLRDVPRFSSRTLDLDLLLYDELVRHDVVLDIPRADILGCAFVLRPLAEIAGQLQHPETGITIKSLWDKFDSSQQPTWVVEFDTGLNT